MDQEKIAQQEKLAQELPGIMQAAAQHLVKLSGENVELIKRAESAELELRAMKLARRMEQRGLRPELSYEEKVSQLLEVEPSRLETMEHAVEMAAGGVSLGKIAEAESTSASVTGDELENFIQSQAALT